MVVKEWILDIGYWVLGAGYLVLDIGYYCLINEVFQAVQENVSRKGAVVAKEKRGKEKLSALATLREISFLVPAC